MGGFFGAVSSRDIVLDVFFGTDYHSHLGTASAGMAVWDAEKGIESGIDVDGLADIMGLNLFIPDSYSKELGATDDDIKAAIFDSIKVSQAVYDGTLELLGMKGE